MKDMWETKLEDKIEEIIAPNIFELVIPFGKYDKLFLNTIKAKDTPVKEKFYLIGALTSKYCSYGITIAALSMLVNSAIKNFY